MKKDLTTKNKAGKIKECNHAIAVHEGHNLQYHRRTKYADNATTESLSDDCCGGITLFNFCPFCGKSVRGIIKKIKP